jgi:hypothetical protein
MCVFEAGHGLTYGDEGPQAAPDAEQIGRCGREREKAHEDDGQTRLDAELDGRGGELVCHLPHAIPQALMVRLRRALEARPQQPRRLAALGYLVHHCHPRPHARIRQPAHASVLGRPRCMCLRLPLSLSLVHSRGSGALRTVAKEGPSGGAPVLWSIVHLADSLHQ